MSFENLLQEYIKKGYSLIDKRKTKSDNWAYFEKKIPGVLLSQTRRLYLYFVDDDINIKHMTEFVSKYKKIYKSHNFRYSDKCIFSSSGILDKKAFRKYARGLRFTSFFVKRSPRLAQRPEQGLVKPAAASSTPPTRPPNPPRGSPGPRRGLPASPRGSPAHEIDSSRYERPRS